jgi:type IV pilus assembly protein PilY1
MTIYRHLVNPLKAGIGFALSFCMAVSATSVYADVSQAPLLLGGGNVPGNLALVPSVEFPTVISVANIDNNYISTITFAGYFDSGKCYTYIYNATESLRYFNPVRFSPSRECSNAGEWSGNFLNWAATQTIDPFRSALTGGYRVVDTATETQLEKARHPRYDKTNNFPNRRLPETGNNASVVAGATPFSANNVRMRVSGLNNQMAFSLDGDATLIPNTPSNAATFIAYDPTTTPTPVTNTGYLVSVRVKVCVIGLEETNCKPYGVNSKPEGLIQAYAKDIRYSAFSYLADDSLSRDGGVLRANQKYVGQTLQDGSANSASEWSATTGVLVANPNPSDASASGVSNSGVINYINKFGQNTNNLKTYDPVSELYYTAIRYFKKQGNVPSYSSVTGNQHDFFPVITNWEDPIQYSCQKNVILGIGDTNTHADRNLPGGVRSGKEPTLPTEVSDDTSINVQTATLRVGELEGVGTLNADSTTGLGCCNNNSAYIAGLAYDSHTKDIRPADPASQAIAGKQTISTHWVDVQENGVLRTRATNQYWLAAKYGGFKVPDDYGDPYTGTVSIPLSAWWTSGDIQTNADKRPDNFYIASDATKMVDSLKKAFANIANEVQSTTASLATNSTRLGTDTAIFQSLLDSRRWSGDLLAKKVATNGVVASVASWSAADTLDALTTSDITSRKIFTNTTPTQATASGPFLSTTGRDFNWAGLDTTQRAALTNIGEGTTTLAENRLKYLRGDRTYEASLSNISLPFRQRASRLADIVNSDPQLIHQQDFNYNHLGWADGAGAAYTTFRASAPYLSRKPLIVVGANDGMLHGFDASISETPSENGGKELFAYAPSAVFSNLIKLTEPNYSHRYFVDGTPRVADAWLGSGTGWKTLAIGTTGAGGNSVFALDITSPSTMTASNVKWEFSHPKMGYTIGQAALVALPNEQFGVIVTSGYHDTAPADGRVWLLNAANGSIIKEFTLPTTGGLGAPLAADINYDEIADRIYVGDTLGNLWRLDLPDNNTSSWGAPAGLKSGGTVYPLFIAKDASGNRQAITAPLSSAFNEAKQHMVYFGTGSFYQNGDNEVGLTPKVDTFYGIIDGGTSIDGRATLLQQKIIKEATTTSGNLARAITQNLLTTQSGWFLDLAWQVADGGPGAKGERVVARATVRNDRIIFTTLTPAPDPCAFGGKSFVMSVNRSSGARLNYAYFDTSGDGNIDNSDTVTIDGSDVPWSGISDEDNGVTKGVVALYKWLCFAGSAGGAPTCIPVSGSQNDGRKSWREVRTN